MVHRCPEMLATVANRLHPAQICCLLCVCPCGVVYSIVKCCCLHPQVVVDRIFARMVACAGIPVALGLVLLYIFYILKVCTCLVLMTMHGLQHCNRLSS
jgi:hypothetical protein